MELPANWWLLGFGGFISGVLAGFLGIGGGALMVPLLVATGNTPIHAVATSSLAILITSLSGTVQNWRMGYLDFKRVAALGLPALVSAQVGVYLAGRLLPYALLCAFGLLLASNIYLIGLRERLTRGQKPSAVKWPLFSQLTTGSAAGVLAGLFGVGGGVIMVPLQMLLLGESIKVAIQTSLAVVVLTAVAACFGHALGGNVLLSEGILLGSGGLLGAQVGTRYLPKLSERTVSLSFQILLALLACCSFAQAWLSYQGY